MVLSLLLVTLLVLFGCPQQGGQPEIPQNPPGAAAKNVTFVNEPPIYTPQQAQQPLVDVSGYKTATSNQRLIRDVVGSFRADEESYNNASRLSSLGTDAIDDVLPLLGKKTIHEQWAGLTALGTLLPKADSAQREKIRLALLPLLSDGKASVRTYAASELLYLGEKSAIPVMIGSLNVTSRLFASEPPLQVCEAANEALVRHTEKDFGFSCSQFEFDANALGKWKSWWAAAEGSISFDSEGKKFVGG